MTDITLTDVTIHIDQTANRHILNQVEDNLRGIDGVISVHMPENRPHLVLVEYVPEQTTSSHLLSTVKEIAGPSEMIGL